MKYTHMRILPRRQKPQRTSCCLGYGLNQLIRSTLGVVRAALAYKGDRFHYRRRRTELTAGGGGAFTSGSGLFLRLLPLPYPPPSPYPGSSRPASSTPR